MIPTLPAAYFAPNSRWGSLLATHLNLEKILPEQFGTGQTFLLQRLRISVTHSGKVS